VHNSQENAYILTFLDFFPKEEKFSLTDGCYWWLASKLMDEGFFFRLACAVGHAQQCGCGKPFISLAFEGY